MQGDMQHSSAVQSYPSDNLWLWFGTTNFHSSFSLYVSVYVVCFIYRVIHDLWTLLQEMIFSVFVIGKFHINMCMVLDGYGVKAA